MVQTDSQNVASFIDQIVVLQNIMHSVDKYTACVHSIQVLTYAKNGLSTPCTGNTFMGMIDVLYVLTQRHDASLQH